ncbi:SxtJ family membrane protein [Terasakiella sp.]|uniref:SxtJ family membrane protein n=1 Tax=Terasakiella sp. TaxID=2034861 RepID=UPI003AA7CA80
MSSSHESFKSLEKINGSSNRSFGIVFAVFFLILGMLPLLGDEPRVNAWLLGISGAFLLLSLIVPNVLAPLNNLWFKFGLLLHKIVTPLIMGIMFFIVITPIALIFKIMGKDLLNRKFDDNTKSYWIERDVGSVTPESMKNQF